MRSAIIKRIISSITSVILLVLLIAGCGSSRAGSEESIPDKTTEVQEEEPAKESQNDDEVTNEADISEKEDKQETNEDSASQNATVDLEFPYGLNKMESIMKSIGYRILEDDDYVPDTEWRTIGIALCIDYDVDNGRGVYETDETTGAKIVPARDVKDYFSVLKPGFNGDLPEIENSYLVSYNKDTDTYSFGMGDFALDIPACDGFRKCENGYQFLCGSKYEDSDLDEILDHDNHGIVTLVHNDYSDTVDDPLFTWTVSDVKVIGKEEYEKILPEFSRNDLLPVAEAYAHFLTEYKTDEYVGIDGIRYSCGYIDADEIPELLMVLDNAHNSTISVFAYRDGDVKKIGEYGSLGSGKYIPYKNILIDHYWGSGADYTTFLKMDGDSLEAFGYVETEPEDITNYDPEHLIYMIAKDGISNMTEVSKEEYEETYKKNADGNPAAAIEVSYTNSYIVRDYDIVLSRIKELLYIQ